MLTYLQQHRLLMILDNFEHVLGAKSLLNQLVTLELQNQLMLKALNRLRMFG